MKNTKILLCFTLLFCSHLNSISQTIPLVTLSEEGVTLERVLRDVSEQTGYGFMVDERSCRAAGKISLRALRMPLTAVLDSCLKGASLYYELIGRSIHIRPGGYVQGLVIDSAGVGVPSATVVVRGSDFSRTVVTGGDGGFRARLPGRALKVSVSSVGYGPGEAAVVTGSRPVVVRLRSVSGELNNVIVSDGFGDIPRERAGGSFTKVSGEALGRRPSASVVDRMNGIVPGLLINANVVAGTNQSAMTIRGRSTIFSNPDPLIIVDNFPYVGDINNINGEDIESVTLLKDAAAASVWGTRAANGVIVIKTRRGRYDQAPKLLFSSSVTAGGRGNIYYTPILSSADYVSVEEYLWGRHYYTGVLADPTHPAISPVVDILVRQQQGQLSAADTIRLLGGLRQQDTRRDLDRYFYRGSLAQQYYLSCSGGSSSNRYYLSAGLDKDLGNLVRNGYNRITVDASNSYMFIPRTLEVDVNMAFTSSVTYNNNTGAILPRQPYLRLTDGQGNAAAVPYGHRQSYIDTAGGGRLLDWHYRPLDELHDADNSTRITDYRLMTGWHYTVLDGLQVHGLYQYSKGVSDQRQLHSLPTYYTRDLINSFSQINGAGQVIYPIPVGGILDESLVTYESHNARLQGNYDHSFNGGHDLHLLAGAELQLTPGRSHATRVYGYNSATETGLPVSSYAAFYPQYASPGTQAQIPYVDNNTITTDRYRSGFINGSYIYQQRYIFTASGRVDQSNLFGVNINHKTVPLWSASVGWELSRESFYRSDALPFLRVRISDGYNGNVYKSVSGYTSASASTSVGIDAAYTNAYGYPYADITNPPNPDLRWEKVQVVNAGVDFGTRGSHVEGSLEYYVKTGQDLIGAINLDPTSGVTQYTGNTANMVTRGVDLVVHGRASLGKVQWNSDLLFNYARDKVTRYLVRPGTISSFLYSTSLNPLTGRPLYALYALQWAGLDPQNGDPQGVIAGHTSKEYTTLLNSADFSSLQYRGPVNPPFFGSWLNSFSWRQWGVSFNIVYKFGDYFRRSSIQYASLFSGGDPGHPDFTRRWQQPGDERRTSVPSMVYPGNTTRDFFYGHSSVLVEKGDLIRLQDLQVFRDWTKAVNHKLPAKAIRLYLYANNMFMLWRANRQGIDPDAVNGLPVPSSFAWGVKIEL